MQLTCFLIKPDGVQNKVIGKVLDRLEKEGFDLVALKLIPPNKKQIENFYSVHQGKPFYNAFIEFMISGPSIASVWKGEDIINRIRKIAGSTNSQEADPGTLRKLYGTDNRRNVVHSSDSPESAEREIGILFEKTELGIVSLIGK